MNVMKTTNKIIHFSRIVELNHEIHNGIPTWPGDPEVLFSKVSSLQNSGYFLRQLSIGEHSATHMNAPSSFSADATSIDEYPPEKLVVPAVVIDVREKAAANADYTFSIEDVLAWEKVHGRVPPAHMVLLYTGWQHRWSSPERFMNFDKDGNPRFPGFLGASTKFLLKERNIAGVGIDTHGVDPGTDQTYETNTRVLASNGIVLECLTHLDKLPPKGITLVIGILRLKDGSGSPVAVTAFVE